MNETSEEHPRAEGEDPGRNKLGWRSVGRAGTATHWGQTTLGTRGRDGEKTLWWAPPQLTPQVPRDQGGRTQEGVPLLPAASVTPAPPSDGAGPRSEGDTCTAFLKAPFTTS